MTPGDPDIRKVFMQICPRRGGEQVPAWLSRVARLLGWRTTRVTSLYKDRRCKLSDVEGLALRRLLRKTDLAGDPAGNIPLRDRLAGALDRDDQLNGFIKDIINEQTNAIVRRFAESLLEALPRDHR